MDSNNVLTPEQMQRLIDNKVDVSNASYKWVPSLKGDGTLYCANANECSGGIPAFCIDDIFKAILPIRVIGHCINKKYIPVYYLNTDGWTIEFRNSVDFSDVFKYQDETVMQTGETLFDTAYNMLLWVSAHIPVLCGNNVRTGFVCQ